MFLYPKRWVPHRRRRRRVRRNPLKQKAFAKKFNELKALGLEKQYEEQLIDDFNNEYNDPTHAIYILNWWQARLALERFLESDKNEDKYIGILGRFAYKYKIDPHDLSLDGELQIDHFHSLRHFAHLAQTNPYFRRKWPRLHVVIKQKQRYRHDDQNVIVGVIRNWDTETRNTYNPKPAISVLQGRHATVGATVEREQTLIPKGEILAIDETYAPSHLITYLKDMEQHAPTQRFFAPEYHEPLISFPDGKAWVVIRSEDVSAEGSSLRDCASAENSKTILVSLREPVSDTHYQALLKAEIVFPSLTRDPTLEEIRNNKGIIVQLRGYMNSKPTSDLHKYVVPLLQQRWIVHLVEPNYSPQNTFYLEDLDNENFTKLRKRKRYLFNSKLFYDKFKSLSYPSAVHQKVLDAITLTPEQIIEALSAKRYGLPQRRKALAELKKRMAEGNKYRRRELLQGVEELLMRTKTKVLIRDIFDALSGYSAKDRLFLQYVEHRKEWLVDNQKFLIQLLGDNLGDWQGHSFIRSLSAASAKVIHLLIEEDVDIGIRLLFDIYFGDSSAKRLQKIAEQVLQKIIDDPSLLSSSTSDICEWYQQEHHGWGNHEHRSFRNVIPLSNKLLRQIKSMVRLTLEYHNDCYMDLALTIARRMSSSDKQKLGQVLQELTRIILEGRRYNVAKDAYKMLGWFVD